ncbi:MAG: hypothetical protein ABW275_10890 [Hansschlegelia sp.]
MRLCFIGNSHLSAFRLGWDLVAPGLKGVEGQFFGARGGDLREMRLKGRSMAASDPRIVDQLKFTSGGESTIDLDAYDGFVLVAIGMGLTSMLRVGAQHRTLATVGRGRHQHLVSDAVFDLAARSLVEESISQQLAGYIRSVTDKPLAAASAPLPCPGVTKDKSTFWADVELLGARLKPVWDASRTVMAEKRRMAILDQPDETMHGRFFTKPIYGRDSVRLKEGFEERHDEDEYIHMNAEYGATFIRSVLPVFGIEAPAAAERARAG